MKEFAGYKYNIYVGGHKLEGVNKITVDGYEVKVEREYAYSGMGGGDCIGIYTSTYSLNEVQIKERVRHELHC